MSINFFTAAMIGTKRKEQQGSVSIKLFIGFMVLVVVLLVALSGWKDIYTHYLGKSPPAILFDEQQPRGIGISPVTIAFTLKDDTAGLDEVVVRTHQKSGTKEYLRASLEGAHEKHIFVDFPGESSKLEEGIMQLEIKVFDKSFWSNSATKTIEMSVDYRKPRVEAVSAMHNARRGGTQVVIYKAVDPALAFSGVKVGNQTFLGFSAHGIDKDIDDRNLFVALYGIDMRQAEQDPPVRLFAQDSVGNASSATFPNKILGRPDRIANYNLTEDFLLGPVSDLTERNMSKIQRFAREMGKNPDFATAPGSPERPVEKFKFLNEYLRVLNEQELLALLKRGGSFERFWTGPFVQQNGIVNSTFGDTLNFKVNNETVGTMLQTGYEFSIPKSAPDVVATADGIVIFNQDLGIFGRIVGIDHGLGLVSIYSRLESGLVKEGETVTAGQPIGTAGRSGLARSNGVYFELRLQGVPVDPREWWDKSWYYSHVMEQVSTAKRLLEISTAQPLERAF